MDGGVVHNSLPEEAFLLDHPVHAKLVKFRQEERLRRFRLVAFFNLYIDLGISNARPRAPVDPKDLREAPDYLSQPVLVGILRELMPLSLFRCRGFRKADSVLRDLGDLFEIFL